MKGRYTQGKRSKAMAKKSAWFNLPPISRFPSRKEWELASWKKVTSSGNLLELVATSYERHNLVMRAAVIDGLNSGKRHGQIAEELFLSPQTISSIKKALGENGYRSYRERSKTERKKRVYSLGPALAKRKHPGRPIRTKYGTIHMPY